jgi:hypothetical protein
VSDRIIAYLACNDLAPVSPETLAARIGELGAGSPLKTPRVLVGAVGQSIGAGFLLDFNGVLVSVILVDKPLPPDAYAGALQLNRVWPGAAQAMEAHRAHAIVAPLKEIGSHLEALNATMIVTITLAALTTIVPSVAVVWSNGEVITEVTRFREAARALVQGQTRPDIWIGFAFLDGPRLPTGERTLAVVTSGLAPFIGREVEWLPTPLPPATIANRLIGLCQYLIVNGPVIKDGETLGVSESDRIRATFAPRGQRGGPVIQLSVETMDMRPPSVRMAEREQQKAAVAAIAAASGGFGRRKLH